MTDTVDDSPLQGEDWWRGLSTKQKAAVLKPYFDKDGSLEFLKQKERNQEIADGFRIHVSSIALQRRWYKRKEKIVEEERETPEEKYSFLIDKLPTDSPHPPIPANPANKGLAWWRSMSAEEKCAVVRPLVEIYKLSTTQISVYLDVKSRNRIAGIRDRLNKQGGKARLPFCAWKKQPPRRYVYLDAPAARDSTTTRSQLVGFEDPGFTNFETAHLLEALLKKNKLAGDMAALLKRLIIGDTLDDDEYEKLGRAILQHQELMKIVEHL